jgi:hypothetical protein
MFISIVVLKSSFVGGGGGWLRMYQEMGTYVGAFKDPKTPT